MKTALGILVVSAIIFGCGEKKEGQESKIKGAVKETVTRPFKIIDKAKRTAEMAERKMKERREQEKELLK